MSQDSREAASPPASADEGTITQAEPRAESRPPGHRTSAAPQAPATLVPEEGWHFLHLFYRVDRGRLADLPAGRREQGIEELKAILGGRAAGAPSSSSASPCPGTRPISASSWPTRT